MTFIETPKKVLKYRAKAKDVEKTIEKVTQKPITEDDSLFLTTLYLSEQGSRLSIENQRLILSKGDIIIFSIPSIKISQIVLLGNISVSSQAVGFCLENKITIFYLTQTGSYKGKLISNNHLEVKNMDLQFQLAKNHIKSLSIARQLIYTKILNSYTLIKQNFPFYIDECIKLLECAEKSKQAKNMDELRGFEGYASSLYFQVIKNEFSDWGFTKRIKRPPTDPVNSLLGFGYTILYNFITSCLTINSLSPYIGIFHTNSSAHASLASDLMEEFRASAIDKVVFQALNNHVFSSADFTQEENQACYISYEAKKKFIALIEENLNQLYTHSQTGFKVSMKRLIDLQAKQILKIINEENYDYKGMIF